MALGSCGHYLSAVALRRLERLCARGHDLQIRQKNLLPAVEVLVVAVVVAVMSLSSAPAPVVVSSSSEVNGV